MKSLIVVVLSLSCLAFVFGNSAPIAGDAKSALKFSGGVKAAWGSFGGNDLVHQLGAHWSFDTWFKYSQKPSGSFLPIITHFKEDSAGLLANRDQDFNLEVLPTGELCFFMGNGQFEDGFGENGYGILWIDGSKGHVDENKWYHVAVTFSGLNAAPYTPDTVNIYINGDLKGTIQWNKGVGANKGSRRLYNDNASFNIGRYNNTDGSPQTFKGEVDEIRFWSKTLNKAEIENIMHLSLTGEEDNLIAYYRCDDSGSSLTDATGNYPGNFRTYFTGEYYAYSQSGVKLDKSVTTAGVTALTITLNGYDADGDALSYYIKSLPATGKLYDVFGTSSVGNQITSGSIAAGVKLTDKRVLYIANTASQYNLYDYFDFVVKDSSSTSDSSRVFVYVSTPVVCNHYDYCGTCNGNGSTCNGAGCDGLGGMYDECGVCAGDGMSCTCVSDHYRNYNITELDRILVHYNIQLTLEMISQLQLTLTETMNELYTTGPSDIDLGSAVEAVRVFNNQCLSDFIQEMGVLLDELKN